MKKVWSLLLSVLLCLSMAGLAGCGDKDKPEPGGDGDNPAPVERVFYARDYTPTSFSTESLSYTVTKSGDGVRIVANSYKLNNGDSVVVYATEVDLSKADVRAGCNEDDPAKAFDKKGVPYQQMTAWENNHPGQKVLVATNADFFANQQGGGAININAFVKDGIIVKDGHNDNNLYDYKDLKSDVPASAPMLFGIKGTTAQIGPIKSYTGDVESAEVKKSLVQSKLRYAGNFGKSLLRHTFTLNVSPDGVTDGLVYLDKTDKTFAAKTGTIVCKIKLTAGKRMTGEVQSVETLTEDKAIAPETGYALVASNPAYKKGAELKDLAAGVKLSVAVASDDGKWDGYETILGCRQALVTDGQIPATLAHENTNGAQSKNIPRTAVGIKNGVVVLFSVESLNYGSGDDDNTSGEFGDETDTSGLSLPELADFIRYYDCTESANFDGGGSTQVVVRGGYNGSGEPAVLVRSSDTGSRELSSSRPVMNTFLITTKKA